jgi:ribosome-associated toxin RatA of RatAB toxin-antitoxin module
MPNVAIHLHAPGVDPPRAYARVSDFARYPSLVETVRQVVLEEPEPDGSVVSSWTVAFRSGLLQWTERDVLDPVANTITFTQLKGDFHSFSGQWRISPAADGGTVVVFEAAFDLGIASLEAILNPIAERTLRSNIRLIVQGLLGEVAEVVPAPGVSGP